VTGILADTEWHPATNPQEATQTARQARDLAVRLRPVLSKLAQAPRGGRRRDLEWLPAVEQLAVDAQYFASWWLPRLEGKSAQSWPSWSADGYADWVKRLDAQRLRTLEMVQGTAPVTRIASVTQLRRGKSEPEPEVEAEAEQETGAEARNRAATPASERQSAPAESAEEEPSAQITPLRGPGAALMDAALLDVSRKPDVPAARPDEAGGETSKDVAGKADSGNGSASGTGSTGSTGSTEIAAQASGEQRVPQVPRTPPNQGPVEGAPRTTPALPAPAPTSASTPTPTPTPSAPHGYGDLSADDPDLSDAPRPSGDIAPRPQVPHTPPNQGPADPEARVGADILQIPRTPPNSGPPDADPAPSKPPAPVVPLVGEGGPRVPRTPPNPGPAGNSPAGNSPAGNGANADTKYTALAPAGPAALGAGARSGSGTRGAEAGAQGAGTRGPKALESGAAEQTRPLFRPGPPKPATSALAGGVAGAAVAGAGAGGGAGAATIGTDTKPNAGPGPGSGSGGSGSSGTSGSSGGSAGSGSPGGPGNSGGSSNPSTIGAGHAVGVGMYSAGSPSQHDEFENFQPGSDLPPPVFPMTEPTEPVDRGRIVRFALAAVVLAAAGVAVFVASTQKGSDAKAATAPPSTSSAGAATTPSATDSPSSSIAGAVTAPTSTDAPPASSSAAKPPPPPPKTSAPPSTAPKTTAPPPQSSSAAAPPPVSHQPPASGGVSSLSITSLAPDGVGGFDYVAHVHVTANGTGTVTVMVTFAGTASSGSTGSTGAQTIPFTMSGKTSYDFTAQTDVHSMCQPSQPYIDAVASASGAGSSVAYASSPC
jgi:hypothetical protein